MQMTVSCKKLDPRAKLPVYATPGAAAADLCALLDEPLTVAPMESVMLILEETTERMEEQ